MQFWHRLFGKKSEDAKIDKLRTGIPDATSKNTHNKVASSEISHGSGRITYLSPEAVKEGIEKFKQQEKHREQATFSTGPACDSCHKGFSIVPSLGFVAGGYQCENCGLRFCTKCSYDAAVAIGRATMICPRCKSDKTKSFRA